MASKGTAVYATACPTSSTAAAAPLCAGGAVATGLIVLVLDEEDVSDRCAKQRLLQLLIRMHIIQHLFRLHRQSMIQVKPAKQQAHLLLLWQ